MTGQTMISIDKARMPKPYDVVRCTKNSELAAQYAANVDVNKYIKELPWNK